MGKVSKRMKAMEAKLPETKAPMPLNEAVALIKQFNTTKFDQSVEISMRLGVDFLPNALLDLFLIRQALTVRASHL